MSSDRGVDAAMTPANIEDAQRMSLRRLAFVLGIGLPVGGMLILLLLYLLVRSGGWFGVLVPPAFLCLVVGKGAKPVWLWILVLVVLGFEVAACILSYYTEGEVNQVVPLMVFAMNGIALVPLAFRRSKAALVAVLVPGLWFVLWCIPMQVVLTTRWVRLRAEVTAIVEHVDSALASRGVYPADLEGYGWKRPGLREYIRYDLEESGDWYQVHHWVVDEHISHWYDSETGWGYYPD